jgi:acetyl-CoA carboxylase carboxyltransferase component
LKWSFVGEGMYADHGGCPSGGVVVKWDTSKENNVLSLQMMPRKSGCLVPITAKKNLRAQRNPMENPAIIYLVDSAGVYLPHRTKSSQTKNILDVF